jgi:4-diphosphocytidyl-2-C-methyl-D-erythritol kinase
MTTLTLPAPAKINGYLHITGKRSDGYHLLDTVFQLIDLHDTVTLRSRDDGRLVLHTPIAGLPNAQHLAMRAAALLKTQANSLFGADIWVEKRIPSGAGLGGGSSDAATTLMGLNHLWQCGLTNAQLQVLGLQLGADVPFFCSGYGTARALGIGEVLSKVPSQNKHYIIAYPDCHVPTPAVFKHPNLTWDAQRALVTDASNWFASGLQNDLQAAALSIAPPIRKAIEWLKQAPSCEGVRMSGSGSAVFAQFANQQNAETALHLLQAKPAAAAQNWGVWLVKSLNEHPATTSF